MVRYLVDWVGDDGVEDGNVPGPHLVKLVALPMGHCALPECWVEPSYHQLSVHLGQLTVQIASHDDLGKMGPHHDGADVFQLINVLDLVLLRAVPNSLRTGTWGYLLNW